MVYELWWRDSLNIAGVYRTQEEALLALRADLVRRGPEFVAGFALEECDDEGDRRTIAEGPELADRVSAADRQPV